MCGIFGHITPGRPIDADACFAATEALSHRGPDGMGVALGNVGRPSVRFHLNPTAGHVREHAGRRTPDLFLGHRRLSIIDLSPAAYQPMSNRAGTVWVVFNGEIYNHQDLRRRLEARGHRFRTDHSDTEVLIHGYEQWGAGLVDQLRGMFAFAVLDLTAGRLLLARDRFGEKPLYYTADPAGVAFASELKALMHLPQLDRTVSRRGLVDFLHHGMIPAPRSVFRAVRKLRAAERVTIRLDTPERVDGEIYWTCPYDPEPGRSEEEWLEAFGAELEESIRLRTISDVPLGTFLSGGLDSTVVTRQLSRVSDRPVSTFSIGFTDARYDESPWSDRAARHFGTRHHLRVLSPDELLEAVPIIAGVFDEPFADSSAVPTYLVSQLAREHVTVALSGDGGDELLAGYARYVLHRRLARLLDWQPDLAVRCLYGPVARRWPESVRGKGLLKLLIPGAKARYFKTFMDEHLVSLAHPGLADGWDCLLESAWPGEAGHPVDQMCQADRCFYIPEDLMVKVDRTSMRVSLEARAPLLDHKLFELVGRMPLRTRFDGTSGKLPFRRLLSAELGEAFVNRPKKGFSVPLGRWFRNELREELTETLLASDGLAGALFPRSGLRQLIAAHQSGSRDQSPRLWKLFMLQKWSQTYAARITGDRPSETRVIRAA